MGLGGAISIQDLAESIKKKKQLINKQHFIIGISGFGGSGKGTLSKKLAEILGDSVVVPLDDFILNRLSARSDSWNSFDWDRLVEQVLKPAQDGAEVVRYERYNWADDRLGERKTVTLPTYIIVEGLGLIREGLNSYLDCVAWVNVSLEIAVARGKQRDREEQGVNHDKLWDEIWSKNDKDYYNKYRPDQKADYLINNG